MPQPVVRQPIPPAFARLRDQFSDAEGEALVRSVSITLHGQPADGLTTAVVGLHPDYDTTRVTFWIVVAASVTGYITNPQAQIPAPVIWHRHQQPLTPGNILTVSQELRNALVNAALAVEFTSIFTGRRLPSYQLTDGNRLLWLIQATNPV